MNEIIQAIAVYALPVIFAITLHEAAHAYAAKYFGDTTAFAAGRMSMNPLRHIDPFGTILLPALMYLATSHLGSPMVFGYAKPVPIDFDRLRNPKKQMAWVALAGPAANFVDGASAGCCWPSCSARPTSTKPIRMRWRAPACSSTS